jgi:Zn finger protein HypA/HybF involved in hydrogenase expression
MSNTKDYYCKDKECGHKLIKYRDVYICMECKSAYQLIDNSEKLIIDDIIINLGKLELLVKIN